MSNFPLNTSDVTLMFIFSAAEGEVKSFNFRSRSGLNQIYFVEFYKLKN